MPHARLHIPCIVALLALTGCAEITGGTSLDVRTEWRTVEIAIDANANAWTQLELHLAHGSLELLACTDETTEPVVPSYGNPVGHVLTDPTTLGTPVIQRAVPGETSLGVLAPPPGRYCAVRLAWFPADDDAEGLAEAPTMLGSTLALEARAVDGDQRVQWRTGARAEHRVALDAPVEITADHVLVVEHDLAAAFARVDPTGDPEADARALLGAIAETTTVRCE